MNLGTFVYDGELSTSDKISFIVLIFALTFILMVSCYYIGKRIEPLRKKKEENTKE
jgi:predicted permease